MRPLIIYCVNGVLELCNNIKGKLMWIFFVFCCVLYGIKRHLAQGSPIYELGLFQLCQNPFQLWLLLLLFLLKKVRSNLGEVKKKFPIRFIGIHIGFLLCSILGSIFAQYYVQYWVQY